MQAPDDLRYSNDHEWVRVIGERVRIGITDFAQSELGDIVFVTRVEVGSTVAAGASITEIDSHKSVSDVYAPVSGTVVAWNDALDGSPETMNSDPYGEGWICEIQMSDPSEIDALMDAAGYVAFVGGE